MASCLPPKAISRILDGKVKGSSRQVGKQARLAQVADSLRACAGTDGSSLQPKLNTLARFADFAAAGGWGGPSIDIFSVEVGSSLVAAYLTYERARGFVESAVQAAPSALVNLRFAAAHMGLDAPDLKADSVEAAAR